MNKIEFLKNTIADDPRNAFAYFALAREYLKVNDRGKARECYETLVQHFPDYGGTYYHYALLLLQEEEPQAATDIINQGIDVLRKANDTHLLSELRALRNQMMEE